MDPRGRLTVSMPRSFESPYPFARHEEEASDAMQNRKVWHAESRAEMMVLLDSVDASGPVSLILWEGPDYKPPLKVRFYRVYKLKEVGKGDAVQDLASNFQNTPVSAILYIAEESGTGKDECSERSWEEEVADKVYMLVGKVPPPKK